MQQSPLAERIQHELAEREGISIVVGETPEAIILSGRVESGRQRRHAEQLARALAPEKRIDDNLEVEQAVAEGIEDVSGVNADELNPGEPAQSPPPILESSGYDASTNDDVPLETDEMDVVDLSYEVTSDKGAPVEEDPTYFPPTDPVIGVGQEGEVEVRGGWTPTAMSSAEVPASAEDNQPGDEALADAITRELREDATTAELNLQVAVEEGVARLRGTVTDLTDAENAEEVAGRVPGVREVIDEMNVSSL